MKPEHGSTLTKVERNARRSPVRHREPRQPEGDVAVGPAPSVLWLVHDDLRTGHGRHACRPLASGHRTARVERLLPDLPVACVEFVARIGRLASGDGWLRWTTPSVTLDPRCRSRPMPLAAITSPSSGAG